MALFARRKHSGRVGADTSEDGPQLGRRATTIGDLLRETREQYGTTIEQIGATLRIRPVFLQAIEGNHYDRLPGPVYAMGFVRTYADHLGLDGEAIAQRFKSEAAGLETKSDLSFPMPLPERSLPGGALLLIALIVAACAYAIWYYRAAGDRSHTERVAEVPAQLIPLPVPVAAPEPNAAAGSSGAPATALAPSSIATGAAVPAASPPGGQIVALPPAAAAPPVGATSPAAPAGAASGAPAAGEPSGAPVGRPGVPLAALPPPAVSAAPADAAHLPAIPEPPGAAPALDTPRVFGLTNGAVRIVIKATADSWVQLRDSDQTAIWTRVLKQGESYRVPDRPGMILRTGNAGSLEITVDGRPVTPIGPAGKTRKATLDPERLIAGTATLE
jgi:cytoskeletal protein RodZ